MNDHHHRFITYLQSLATRDRGALATLRRSLGFPPGTFAAAMPIVEPFVARDNDREPARQALYLAAGLFAANPRQRDGTSLAKALADLQASRGSSSVERRFMALLSADAEGLPVHLRHAVSLLAADEQAYDHAQLVADLERWLDPWRDDERNRVRQRWARDFYRSTVPGVAGTAPEDNDPAISQEDPQ